jgi:hypothetical protein
VGIGAWTSVKTSQPVGPRYVKDGADQ